MNYESWTIHPDNFIRFSPTVLQTNNFDLSKDLQHLIVQSKNTSSNSPVEVIFKDFRLATLTGIFQTDSLLADGTLNGVFIINDMATQPNFTTDLSIKNLTVNGDTIGDVHAIIDNTKAKVFAINIALTGRGNDVSLNGNYFLKLGGKSSMDLVLDIKTMQMRSLQGASLGNIRDSKGHLSGKVIIGGNMVSPDIHGNLEFFQTSMVITKLNSVFKVDNGQILAIDNKGLKFNSFTIKDVKDNRFTINGSAFTKNYINYVFDLRLRANNFQPLNSTRADNQAFYGKIIFSTDMRISGTEKAPVIDGRLKLKEGSDFTIVLPQTEPGLVARDGVVVFVDKDAPVNDELFYSVLDSLNSTSIFGMEVSVNIEIDKKASLTLVIDESNNDHLKLKGEAILNGGIDKSGKVTLTGTYELDEGTYEMSFNLLERRFNIQKGSKITWSGEPTDGNLNITAVYTANTSAVELVQDQIVEAKTDLRYRQELPFEVHLSMTGPLLQPVLKFEIKLPKESLIRIGGEIAAQIEMRLQQLNAEPSELNKQVFALLILNRFTSQNPFESAGGGINAESMARQSVSKILTAQLNKLAEDLVSGVDINFDIVSSEDYTTGTMQNKTDLAVGVSKKLFNERLNVTLGTNIVLEGGQQNSASGNLGASNAPNVNIEYLLSNDGRYMLRAYRRNKYEGIIEGYIIETGVGFVMAVDYDKFKEIFRKKVRNRSGRRVKTTDQTESKPETPPLNEPEKKQSPVINNERKDEDEN
ncbi:MAG: translocation/assembly module TamB [Saprospiraceae bacterium]|nr:translocation/assembly module TamB [Saprospiraceae bacterium]